MRIALRSAAAPPAAFRPTQVCNHPKQTSSSTAHYVQPDSHVPHCAAQVGRRRCCTAATVVQPAERPLADQEASPASQVHLNACRLLSSALGVATVLQAWLTARRSTSLLHLRRTDAVRRMNSLQGVCTVTLPNE